MFEPVRQTTRSLPILVSAAALLFVSFSGPAQAEGPESVVQLVGAPGHTVWQITRPNVNQASTNYPQITFKQGSTVTVTATGCVGTGGKGLAWKRYVNPAGDKSATLYHGEIAIPGATNGLEIFKPAQPTVYTIPANAPLQFGNYLRLGYTDTDYKDNGYNKFDNGDSDQCKGLGDAIVIVDIAPIQAAGVAPATASYTFAIQNVTIQRLRSLHNDTDILAASVVVDGTPSSIGTQELGKVQAGSHGVNFSVLVDSVTPTDRIAIDYVVANEGHGASQQKVDALLAGAVGKVGLTQSNGGSAVAAIAGFWTIAYDLANPDCDGPVAAGQIAATGAEMFAEAQGGAYQRTISFPGSKSADGCGSDSYYQLTYSITPVSTQAAAQISSYSFKVNAAAKTVQPGSDVRVIPNQ